MHSKSSKVLRSNKKTLTKNCGEKTLIVVVVVVRPTHRNKEGKNIIHVNLLCACAIHVWTNITFILLISFMQMLWLFWALFDIHKNWNSYNGRLRRCASTHILWIAWFSKFDSALIHPSIHFSALNKILRNRKTILNLLWLKTEIKNIVQHTTPYHTCRN